MRRLSSKELQGVAAMCAGVAFLLIIALVLSGSIPFLPSYLRVAVSKINQTAAAANAAAVPYWQTASGNYGGYPSPTSCSLNFQSGANSANCGYSFPAGILSAVVPATSVGTYTYGSYQLGFYSPCYPSTGSYYSQGFTGAHTSGPLVVLAGSPVQLDWACQPSQSASIYMACGDGWEYPSASIYSSSYVTSSLGTTYPAGGNPLIGTANVTAPLISGATTNYNLYCSGTLNATVPVQASVATLSLTPTSYTVLPGGSTMLNWAVNNTQPGSCKVTNQAGTVLAREGGSQAFSYTGGNQTYTVPAGVTSAYAKLWGAGAGNLCSSAPGGAGGYTAGTLAVTPGQVLTIIAGGAGALGGGPTYGGGGGASDGFSTSGGGRSAIRDSISGIELMTAGGGGAGSGLCSTAMAPTIDFFAEAGTKLLAALPLWPTVASANDGAILAGGGGGGGTSYVPGDPGGGTTGAVGGGSPYRGGDVPASSFYGAGGGGYIGGAAGAPGYGGTGFCGGLGVSACTTTTGGGSGSAANGQVLISVAQPIGNVSTGALTSDTSFTLSCTDLNGYAVSTSTTVSILTVCPNGVGPAGSCTACNSGYVLQGTVPTNGCVPQCPNGQGLAGSCTSCNSGYVLSGGNCAVQCVHGSGVDGSCTSCNSGYVLSGGYCVAPPPPSIPSQLTATPPRVRSGSSTSLSWSTVSMTSCTLKNDSGTTLSTAQSSAGLAVTITSKTTFTLSCTDGTNTYTSAVTVPLIPLIQEI